MRFGNFGDGKTSVINYVRYGKRINGVLCVIMEHGEIVTLERYASYYEGCKDVKIK